MGLKTTYSPWERGVYRVTMGGSITNFVLLSFLGVSGPHLSAYQALGCYCALEEHVCMDVHITLREAAVTMDIERKLKGLLGERTLINIDVEPRK